MPSSEEQRALAAFLDSPVDRPLLGLVYGRRRIGKSTLLVDHVDRRGGFYFEATRVETPVQLERLGAALGEHLGVGRLALDDWEAAVGQLLRLGQDGPVPVVLDEFGHIMEADRSVDSILATAFGPGARRRNPGQARLVLCGSAIAMMRALTAGEAPLRGRAGLELVMQPDDFRMAATRLPQPHDLPLAVRVHAVIGGVVGYATDMANFDLPATISDFDRWVSDRVLTAAAPLHYEATTLLAEDPTLAGTRSLLHHSILGAIANGSVTAGNIANRVGRQVSNLAPALNRLVDAGFVVRHEDPIRKQRPLYALADPYLQFHYAILEPHRPQLRARDPRTVWPQLTATFDSRVRGPVFEQQARTWVSRFADDTTGGQPRDHVGPSVTTVDGVEHELDVVVAGTGPPAERAVTAIGEAKAGQTLDVTRLRHLERARASMGPRAAGAALLLFAPAFTAELRALSDERSDVELIDLDRLYRGG